MKAEARDRILKLAYLMALGSLYSTAAIILKSILLDGLLTGFDFVSIFSSLFYGYFITQLISRWEEYGKTHVLIIVFSLLPAAAAWFFYTSFENYRSVIEFVIMEAAYFTGARAYYKAYAGISDFRWTLPGIIPTVVGIILAVIYKSASYPVVKPFAFFCLYVFIILSVILENQKSIDYLMNEMMGQTPKLPLFIRRFNLYVMLLASGVITLLAFSGPVLKGARSVFGGVGRGIRQLLLKLFNLLFTVRSGPLKELPESPGIDRSKEIKPLEGQGMDEKIVLIIMAVLGVVLVILLARKLPGLFRELKRSIFRLISFIRTKFSILNRPRLDTQRYDDEVEFSKAVWVDEVLPDNSTGGPVKRSLPRKDSVLQVRYYYAVILDLLSPGHIKLRRSDTTGEIRKKAIALKGVEEPMGPVTQVYDSVRYGGLVPGPEAVQDMENNYRRIKATLAGIDKDKASKRKKK